MKDSCNRVATAIKAVKGDYYDYLSEVEKIEETTQKAEMAKRSFLSGTSGSGLVNNGSNADRITIDLKMTVPSNRAIEGSGQSGQKPYCCHCGGTDLNILNDGRYRCLGCKKRFVANKVVWKQ